MPTASTNRITPLKAALATKACLSCGTSTAARTATSARKTAIQVVTWTGLVNSLRSIDESSRVRDVVRPPIPGGRIARSLARIRQNSEEIALRVICIMAASRGLVIIGESIVCDVCDVCAFSIFAGAEFIDCYRNDQNYCGAGRVDMRD